MDGPKSRSNGTPPTGAGNETLVEDILERENEQVNRMKKLERMLASLRLQLVDLYTRAVHLRGCCASAQPADIAGGAV